MKRKLFLNLVSTILLVSSANVGAEEFASVMDYEEYYVSLGDSIEIGTSRAFECVGVIAHMAGFEEYSAQGNADFYDTYFNSYKNNKDVKKAINKFKSLRNTKSMSYDAVASLGTYLTSDCHSYRVSKEILLKNIDSRCASDTDSLLKVVSAFYDATNFAEFYEQNKETYKKLADNFLKEKDLLLSIIDNYVLYYKEKPNKLRISSSYINGGGNYGMCFMDGNTTYFEPKFCALNNGLNVNLIVHELSHPNSNPVAEKIYKNVTIRQKIEETFEEKRVIQEQMGYGTVYTYIIELVNRANTVAVMKQFCSEKEINNWISYEKQCRFDEIETIVGFLENYKKGNYNNFMEFEPEFEKLWLEYYSNL